MTESGRTLALDALAKLEAGGSTNGGSGIKRAYQIAKENFLKGSVNDKVDAGDIGAGHAVTAFYEIVPTDAPQPNANGTDPLKYQKPTEKPAVTAAAPSEEWLTLKLRHKSPEGDISSLQETVVKGPAIRWQDSDGDFTFASAVALFGMKLHGMDEASDFTWSQIRELATPGLKDDRDENRTEFIGLRDALEKRGK